jgi:hypothetical protein
MSQFSPETFLDMSLDTPLERREPLPVGLDYTAVIGDVKARTWTSSKDPSKTGIAWDVPLTIDGPAELQQSLGLPSTLQLKDSIMIDLTDNGNIDTSKGKNGRLRQYREACDLNKVGDSFSARKMTGAVIKLKITHEPYNGNIVERPGAVAKL